MDTTSTQPSKSEIKFKLISQTFIQNPPIFTIEKILTREKLCLNAAELFNLGYVYYFSPVEIAMITYSYAEQQFMQELQTYYLRNTSAN